METAIDPLHKALTARCPPDKHNGIAQATLDSAKRNRELSHIRPGNLAIDSGENGKYWIGMTALETGRGGKQAPGERFREKPKAMTTMAVATWLALAVMPAAIAQSAPAASGTMPVVHAPIPLRPTLAASGQTAGAKARIPAASTPDAQTLHALYNAACDYDAPYRAALAQVRASAAAVSQARAALLPQVGLQADVQGTRLNANAKEPITLGVDPATGLPVSGQSINRNYAQNDVGISARQPLYRPASNIALDQSKRQLDVAQVQLAAVQQNLMVRLAQAYFDVLAAQETLRYLGALKDAVSRQLAMAQRNFEIGNANVTDSREAKARLATTRAREIAAQNDLRVKQLALEQLVGKTGVYPRPLAEPMALPALNPQDINVWAARAANAPVVRQARLALEVARLEVDKAKTGHLPSLDLQASVGRAQFPSGNPMGSIAASTGYQTTLSTVGVQLTWPLIAGGAVLARERETLALQDKAQAQLDDALRGSVQATRAAYFNLQSGLEQTQALQAAQEASRTALDADKLGYKIGARTNIDVLNAQTEVFQTQRDLARARYDALIGLLRLKQAAGVLMPSDLTQIDKLLAR
jgi:outer membrane protein